MTIAKIFVVIIATTVAGAAVAGGKEVIDFLSHYGYLNNSVGAVVQLNDTVVREALTLFQDYYRLSGDGALTDETVRYMRKSRCGVRDISRSATDYLLRKWPKKNLTWNFLQAQKIHLNTAREAFDMWARHSALKFTRVNRLDPDILISFQKRSHASLNERYPMEMCMEAFDGPGLVIAHAVYPNGKANFAGEVHLDSEEPWHITVDQNPLNTMSLLDILIHEIGHALGLEHNTRNDSVMYPFTQTKQFPILLSIEDILNIQNLYGTGMEPITTTTTTTTTTTVLPPTTAPPPPPLPDLCSLKSVDAVLVANHKMYVAYKTYIWSVSLDGSSYSKPMKINDYLTFLPRDFTRVTALYQRPSGDIVLIANNLVYSIENPALTLREGWPKNLTYFNLPVNAKIDVALNTNTGRTFMVFNDRSVVEIDERSMRVGKYSSLDETFPGIPPSLKSAFRYIDGNLYFTKGDTYYEFNEFTNTVTKAGKFDLRVIHVICPTHGLLRQLRDLLYSLATIHGVFASDDAAL